MSIDPTKLRVAIGEKMGKCMCRTYQKPGDFMTAVCDGCGKNPFFAEHEAPEYPLDPAAALSLCDWMNAKGWTPTMNMTIGGEWRCIFDGIRFQHIATAPTLPLAICLAFAKANNLTVE